ncbi:hydantoinase/oxoprolinase family protein [Natribacillus halophilus]|uniref:N-methylhydantoinase A n=1 Tax=Natribacillus halophilus TaxID=549003 RepID=A0A1G8R873_9BACI|nr:hydantoinase/oxoprolinase family protein [Natribacillus halophilus]SDJ13167.1 N-methylhydantoinase A [Natribacillus halophilus]
MSRYHLGVDIGGTFTDVVLLDNETGRYTTAKSPSTPNNLSNGVINGIKKLVTDLSEVDFFVHGTTAGINALLERKGAKMALVVTKGFKDLYEIGRANRPEIYNIQYRQPEKLISRRHIIEVEERMSADGSVDNPLRKNDLEQLVESLENQDFDSVSICLIHAYKNPDHEKMIKEYLQERLPTMSISLSHEMVREWREYERISTTVINAYVAPIIEDYLEKLEKEAELNGLRSNLHIMQSNGGVMTAEVAKEIPVQTLMSGPVGGTIGSIEVGQNSDHQNLICVDMGGTSFDVSLAVDGEPDVTAEAELEKFPIMTPMVDIHTIGAGGGSTAWVEGGGLRVGPESAGSDPGPACYGKGGNRATVTDANLILGRIDSESFLGGDMSLDVDAAYKVIEDIANKLGLSIVETAEGVCDIANAKMADAIRTLTVSKGIDPRDFALVAFGGAGPLHAMFIAEHLGINKVKIPAIAGTFSAWGMLQTDIRHDDVRTYVSVLDESDVTEMNGLYEEMKISTKEILSQQKIQEEDMLFQCLADLRYAGQEYTVTVPLYTTIVEEKSLEELKESFHDKHFNIYGHNNRDGIVEIVNLRLIATGYIDKAKQGKNLGAAEKEAFPIQTKPVIWENKRKNTTVYSIDDLFPSHKITGPTIIETPSSTIVVPENFVVEVDNFGNLELTRGE